ncbi:MAG: hypothetical protein IJ334_11770 [Clostridia bacterium]|nr:hypothetical protein [Clostridia bacterium]
MEIKFNIETSQRKALAQKIGELTGAEVKYLGVPSCGYQIDIFTLSKDAVLSFTDRSDTEIAEKVLDGLAEAGYESETVTYPEGTETDAEESAEPEDAEEGETEPDENTAEDDETEIETNGFPIAVTVALPLTEHTVQSLTNLICMIHARGALLSKATGGAFAADKSLVDEISNHEFRSIHELIAYIREWEETNPELKGIRFSDDKLIFDGFGEAPDADHVQAFTNLAAAMNSMAITQKRVQAKDVDDSNEKYTMRVWLVRIGFGGADHKTDRRILLEHLTGHTAFRNDTEKEKWMERQKAKREAAKAAAQTTEEEENDAVSE